MITTKSLYLAIIVFVCLLSFWPSLFNQFTNWDDDTFVTENPRIKSLNPQNLKVILTGRFIGGYQPLTMVSWAVEYHFFKLNSFFYHLDNLILHIFNVCFVFLIINLLTKNLNISLITALLFAISPLRVESVGWVAERKDVLFAFFFLLSMMAYLQKRFWTCWALFVLSCLAKHQAVVMPFILLSLDYWQKRQGRFSLWLEKWPFFLAGAILLSITLVGALPYYTNVNLYAPVDKFFLSCVAFILYVVKIFIPYQLACLYPYPAKTNGFFPWEVYASPAVILLAALVIFKLRHRYPVVLVGSLFFSVIILLSLMTVAVGSPMSNDRYTYLPSVGLYWIMAYVFQYCFHTRLKTVVVVAMIVYIFSMGWLTFRRCKIWYNGISLWSDMINQYPWFAFSYDNRGTAYTLQGQYDLAFEDFSRAIELNPSLASAYNNRGFIYSKQGKRDLALRDFNKTIELNPNLAQAYSNRGMVYRLKGNQEQAILDYTKAIELKSDYAEAYNNRGNAYNVKDNYDQAIFDYNKAIELKPDYAEAYNNRALIYYFQHDYAKAWGDVYKAQELGYKVKQSFFDLLKKAFPRR